MYNNTGQKMHYVGHSMVSFYFLSVVFSGLLTVSSVTQVCVIEQKNVICAPRHQSTWLMGVEILINGV